MQGTILLNYQEDTRQIETEEKSRFLRDFLIQLFDSTEVATQVEEIWGAEVILTAPQKIQLRQILTMYNVQALDDNDGRLKIYLDDELVGEWQKCTYVLRKDLQVRDPKRRLYIEMSINYWTIFEENNDQSQIQEPTQNFPEATEQDLSHNTE